MKTVSMRHGLAWLPAAALLVAIVGWASHRSIKQTLEADLQDELLTILHANVAALDIWLDTQSRLAAVLASDPALRNPILTLATQPPTVPTHGPAQPGIRRAPAQGSTQALVQATLDTRLQASGYGAALVLGTNLQVLATSQRARNRLGETLDGEHAARVQQALASGRPSFVMPFKAGFGRPGARPPKDPRPRTNAQRPHPRPPDAPARIPPADLNLMEVVAPVLDAAGNPVAAIVFVLRPEEEFTRVLSIARPGLTGETFAFDAAGRLISASRFDDELRRIGLLATNPAVSSALNIELRDPGIDLTRTPAPKPPATTSPLLGMVSAAMGSTSPQPGLALDPERDYRGVPVVGAWRWNPDRHYGVATKIDASEAFRPLQVLRRVVVALLLLLALAMVVMLVVAHAGATWQARFDEERLKARQLGQYALLAKIGEGAMGVVYRARHAFLRRETAVKLLLPDRADDALVRQFEQEVRLTCTLSHPNTIQIYDYGRTHDGIFYYAMELLQGLSLHQLVELHGPQPPGRVIHLLAQAALSLREAHAAGLIHRDIKPGNLFLCRRGGIPDTLKVLDFGLVQRTQHGQPNLAAPPQPDASRRFLGTPLYMAPETIRQHGFGDARSDLYALAAVGHVLLTGKPLFDGPSTEEVWHQQQTLDPRPPSSLAPHPVSEELNRLLLQALAKDPGARPPSMDAFLDQLLACPEAGSWTEAMREHWWNLHGPAHQAAQDPAASAPAQPTVLLPAGTAQDNAATLPPQRT